MDLGLTSRATYLTWNCMYSWASLTKRPHLRRCVRIVGYLVESLTGRMQAFSILHHPHRMTILLISCKIRIYYYDIHTSLDQNQTKLLRQEKVASFTVQVHHGRQFNLINFWNFTIQKFRSVICNNNKFP